MSDQNLPVVSMFPIEIIVFCILAFTIFKLKNKYPNMLFPPFGVTVFLPPTEEDMKEVREKDQRKSKTAPQMQLIQIKMMKSEANHYISVPFSNELEITMLFTYMLFAQFFILECVKAIAQIWDIKLIDSSMLFYFGLIIFYLTVGNIYKAATIGGYDQQQTRMTMGISVVAALIVLVVFLGFKDYIDINIKHEFQRQAMHFEIVMNGLLFSGIWSFISAYAEIFILVLSGAVAMLLFCTLPVIIRFGNCFLELKESIDKPIEEGSMKPNDKKLFYCMALQLLMSFAYIALQLKPFTKSLEYTFQLQLITLATLVALQIATYRMELDMHMYKGYDWLSVLADQPELQDPIVRKVRALLKGMIIVAYQVLSKILIPVVLFMLLIIRHDQINDLTVYKMEDYNCIIKEVNTMELLFNTTLVDDTPMNVDQGLLIPNVVMARIQKYGFLSKSFMYSLIEFILFNYVMLNGVLSVFYIFFLTKTKTVKQPQQKSKKQ